MGSILTPSNGRTGERYKSALLTALKPLPVPGVAAECDRSPRDRPCESAAKPTVFKLPAPALLLEPRGKAAAPLAKPCADSGELPAEGGVAEAAIP